MSDLKPLSDAEKKAREPLPLNVILDALQDPVPCSEQPNATDLLPCPFCGDPTDVLRIERDIYAGTCTRKGCFIWPHASSTEEEATGVINARPSPWIPVSERLPERGALCLAAIPFTTTKGMDGTWVRYGELDPNGVMRSSEDGDALERPASHWMPLPLPPEEKQ